MAEITSYGWSIRELTETLIREQGVTSGHWEVGVVFGAHGHNLSVNGAPHLPTIMVQIQSFVLTRVAAPTPLSVDAATAGTGAEFPVELPASQLQETL